MPSDATAPTAADPFGHARYQVRSKLLRLFGGAYHIYDDAGGLALYSEMKRFRLKEDIRLYEDESMTRERLRISTQSIFDISGAYDVVDSTSDEHVGTLRRAGLSSTFLRDRWAILDADGREIGEIQEDSLLKALARRFVEFISFLLPQKYHVNIDGALAATIQQRFNPVIFKLDVDFSADATRRLDRRLGLAAAVLLSAVEGRQ